MKFILDRFEGDFAVLELESKEIINITRKIIPPDAKEGDVIEIVINKYETRNIYNQISNKLKKLMGK